MSSSSTIRDNAPRPGEQGRADGDADGPARGEGADEPLLVVENLSVTFSTPRGDVRAIVGASLNLAAGAMMGLVGESGSGKSVMARALMGLLPKESTRIRGSIRLAGEEVVGRSEPSMRTHRGRDVAMVFQDPMRSFNPIMTVGAQVSEAIRLHRPLSRKEARRESIELLKLVRIPLAETRYSNYPHELSGGMRQRVMMAMALACRPKLLIADEPTTSLDVTTQAAVMDLLRELQEELSMSVIFITHDLNLAAVYTDEVSVMYAGHILERFGAGDILKDLRVPYSQDLIRSIPDTTAAPHTPLHAIAGMRPDPVELLSGCPFHPRCHAATVECATDKPPFDRDDAGHSWSCWHPTFLEDRG